MSVAMIGPKFYGFDKDGNPLAFGKLYTYQARTNTPKDTYQSEDQQVANTNPIILNGEGYANVYLSGSYKMVLKDSNDNEIWTSDPVSASQPEEWVNCLTPTYLSSTSFEVNGNFTAQYEVGRAVRIDNNTTDYSYSKIQSSTFAASKTTIVISDPVVTTGVIESCVSIVGKKSIGFDLVKSFDTLASAVADTGLVAGDTIILKERTTGNGGGATWDVVAAGTYPVGATIFDVFNHDTLNLQLKLKINTYIWSKQHGVTGNGSTDDSAAMQAASDLSHTLAKTLIIDGTPLIKTKISIALRVHWQFLGAVGQNGSGPSGAWSFLKKDDSMTTEVVLVTNTAKGCLFDGMNIEGDKTKNSGDGLVIQGNSTTVMHASILGMGRDGIRIGSDSSSVNANSYDLYKPYCAGNGRDGIHVTDQILGGSSNANAGVMFHPDCPANGRHGIYGNNAGPSAIYGAHAETNAGWGVYLDHIAQNWQFRGGDIEGNITGDIFAHSSRSLVTGAANNGAGKVRLAVEDTSKLTTGETVKVNEVVGTTEANGFHVFTVIDATHIDLDSVNFSNAYVSGGTINNFAGGHVFDITYGDIIDISGAWLSQNLSRKGNGKDFNPINVQGDWTPTLTGNSSAGTPSYGAVTGKYQLVGDICEVFFDVTITDTVGMVGLLRLSNLPFEQADSQGTGFLELIHFSTFPAGTVHPGIQGNGANSKDATILFSGSGITSAGINVTALNAGGNTRIRGRFTYKALVS
ncbi:MAG: hypothetical protein QM500_19015 [Methylococcales bacterium]